jgi:hypothetical protein
LGQNGLLDAAWQRDPLNFWAEAPKEIDWIQAPQKIF